ncbi:MAG: biotin/lipoyl-binding protein [Bacteroidetes bacterium]|nr:MAG: biotin/lipoyl-binding protein [Bacteroidota bacterium]
MVDDATYKTQLNKMYMNRKPYVPFNPSHLKSFMPGNIPEVFVNVGDQVKEGDILLILEAMKMKNHILAPFDGTVTAINVKIGDRVPKNHVLLEVKP